ncbi:hypothetical protein [Bacillus sp. B15-48]|nr:hypothetical protein [Bacillus sp. B15-48]MBM4763391.1 hypothetical protein [Bacillus sp. B15-48]
MEQVVKKRLICSKCKQEITDVIEFEDNDGVCDDCYSIPIKKRIGKLK